MTDCADQTRKDSLQFPWINGAYGDAKGQRGTERLEGRRRIKERWKEKRKTTFNRFIQDIINDRDLTKN